MAASTISNLQVIYEDNHLIAVNKRASDLSQGDKSGDAVLGDIVKAWIKKKYDKPGNVYLGTLHRLDRPVSGILLFGKTSKATTRMSEMFKNREVEKTYWAVVANRPPQESGTLEQHLKKNRERNKSYVTKSRDKLAKLAQLDYRLLASSDRYHLLEVNPKTGRHHQIRVQLASMDCIIKGDLKYGAPRSNKDASIHLHARKLKFLHPVTKEPLVIEAPVPDDNLWKSFGSPA